MSEVTKYCNTRCNIFSVLLGLGTKGSQGNEIWNALLELCNLQIYLTKKIEF